MSSEERHITTSITIPRSFWYSSDIAIAFVVVIAFLLILSIVFALIPEEVALAVSLPGTLVSFFLSWIGFKFPTRKRNQHIPDNSSSQRRLHFQGSFIFSMALASQCLGDVLHIYYDTHHYIFPSWADAAILGAYPLLLLGVLRLPTQTLGRNIRLRVLLDSSLIIVALVTFSWHFLLGPMLLQNTGESLLGIVTHLAFPASDLLLISYVILLSFCVHNDAQRLMVRILSIALIIFTLNDSIFQYQLLHNVVLPGWCILGWCAGNFMIALAAQSMNWLPVQTNTMRGNTSEPATQSVAPIWQILLPYALIPAVLGLTFYQWGVDRISTLAIGTYFLSVLLLILVFVKQVVTIREIHWLNRGLYTVQHSLYEKNEALERANARFEVLATTDPLTGLPNHRALQATLTQELDRAQRYSHDCTLLFFDLDYFKALNDGYGHAVGDEALSALGRLLREHIRSIDTVGRWGGEEFLVILPETTMQEARIFAERLRELVSQHTFTISGGLHLTCSIGLASCPTHSTTLNDLINAADQAMYAAKQLGRNQWRCIDDPEVQRVISVGDNSNSREEMTQHGVIKALVSLIELRDATLGDHSHEVAGLVEQIALKLGNSPQEVLTMALAGHLHDIGKIGVPDAILQKSTCLTEDEWRQMKLHPEAGAEVIVHIPFLRPLASVIRAHHERWDGTGYPDQLEAEAIPLAARVIAVANAYMTMVVDHPCQKACSVEDAVHQLQRWSGTQFDSRVVNALTEILYEQACSSRVETLQRNN